MTKEASASQIYLSYASWASGEGCSGLANFLFRHANEERNHMMKFLEYILERGGKVKIEAIPAVPKTLLIFRIVLSKYLNRTQIIQQASINL